MIIFIDSNIIRGDPRTNTPGMQAISYYSRIGILKVYVSEIVKDEVMSNNQDITDGAIDRVVEALNSLKKAGLSDTGFKKVNELIESVDREKITLKTSVNERFIQWIYVNKIVVYPIDEEIYKQAMQAYFTGLPPFKKRREREHLPDAMIYYSIKQLVDEFDSVIFLSNDTNLANYVSLLGCTCYARSEELVSSSKFKEYIEDNIADYERDILKVFSDAIVKNPRTVSAKILHKLWDDFPKIAEINLPAIMGSNPQFTSLLDVLVTHISPKFITLVSANELSIEFYASVEVSIVYAVHKSVFERYEFGNREITVEEQGEDCIIQENVNLSVEGRASIGVALEHWISALYHDRAIQRIIDGSKLKIISCLAYPRIEREHLIDFKWIDVSSDESLYTEEHVMHLLGNGKPFPMELDIDQGIDDFPPDEEDLPF
ncbi:PIN domain-containing protein [Deinococcus aquaedulcis]|uniref:PIN domain-containing protein n=1 Tax=Deinococcus aquaedulcis TaxID=2840455 RepID=UPI001C83AD16|nr:PIN domain-containing protein [Deinococcus aquaedulcis]